MARIAIIGAGSFAVYVAHLASAEHEIVGYFCNQRPLGTFVENIPILGSIDDIERLYHEKYFDELLSGVGYLQFQYRKLSFERFWGRIPFATIIHSRAYVDPSSRVGEGSVIHANCVLDKGVRIGHNVFLGPTTTVAHESSIGAHCITSAGVTVAGSSHVGESVFTGVGSVIKDKTTVCDNAKIGIGSVVVMPIKKPDIYHFGVPAVPISDM
jgi:UDP-3-O-[3-hydroxymyristoyl] glucosamine N-acyltransferase